MSEVVEEKEQNGNDLYYYRTSCFYFACTIPEAILFYCIESLWRYFTGSGSCRSVTSQARKTRPNVQL